MNAIRNVVATDVEGLKEVLDSIELFSSEYLDDMLSDYLQNPNSTEVWFTKIHEHKHVALGYCSPEKFTNGTYNLYAIGVKKEFQGHGIGKEMMSYIEHWLRKRSQRILIVETSSDAQFALTREFYSKIGYRHEATIRDFWQEGEHKVIFWKKLT